MTAPPASPLPEAAEVASLALPLLVDVHLRIRDAVVTACASSQDLAAVAADGPGDTIYAVDRVSEAVLVEALAPLAERYPLRLVAEGVEAGCFLPRNHSGRAVLRVIVDPIDGTRGLMYQKRPAWILTGVALEREQGARLRDVFLAVQTEIPLLKQHLADQMWAERNPSGIELHMERHNILTGEKQTIRPAPSRSRSLAHGFATVVRFFPGVRDILGEFDEALMKEVGGRPEPGKALCFEDQYLSTGGQLYELMMGHDRFIADLRPLIVRTMEGRGQPAPLCCHPYDVCAAMIAEAAGVIVEDAFGNPLDVPLDLETDVAWVAYANRALRDMIAPQLTRLVETLR